MEKCLSVVAADPSEDFRRLLEDIISEEKDLSLTAAVADGETLRKCLRETQPDVLVCNLCLRGCDTLSLLKELGGEGIRPPTLLVSAFYGEARPELVSGAGAERLICLPCGAEQILEGIRACGNGRANACAPDREEALCRRLEKAELEMRETGIVPHLRGYVYLMEVFSRVLDSGTEAAAKVLYPLVAEKFGTSPANVERCIRSAVDFGWHRRRNCGVFAGLEEKPGNLRYIRLVAARAGEPD